MMSLFRARESRRQLKSGERGGSAVEAAIVTPIVMALLFGIIELGFLFKDYLAAAGAVRAGVRMASATPRNATFAQSAADRVAASGEAMNFKDVEQLWVYKANPITDPPASQDKPFGFSDFSNCTTCVKFGWDVGTSKFIPIPTADNWPASSQNACGSSTTGGPSDRIGVYIQLKHDAFTGLVFKTVNISEASIMSLEPISIFTACRP